MTPQDRTKLLERVRNLLAKTVENGCTEHEAIAAAQKVSALMEQYDLSHEDVEDVKRERYGARKRPFANGSALRRVYHESTQTHYAISRLFTCEVWLYDSDLIFFGSELDTEAAHSLANVVRIAMDLEWRRYKDPLIGLQVSIGVQSAHRL